MTLGAQSLSRQVCRWPGAAETLDGVCPPPVPWGAGVGGVQLCLVCFVTLGRVIPPGPQVFRLQNEAAGADGSLRWRPNEMCPCDFLFHSGWKLTTH